MSTLAPPAPPPAAPRLEIKLWRLELSRLVALAWPLAATQLAQMAVTTTDVVMLGRLGGPALAAAALGSTVFYFVWIIGFGPIMALAPMIAHARGRSAASQGEVRRIARMGLWSVFGLSPPLMALLFWADPILQALRQEPRVAADAGRLVALFALGLPFSFVYQALRAVSSAVGRPKAALVVMAATIGFNAAADYALIFGRLGAPRLGLTGAGLATSASFAFSACAMAIVFSLDPELSRLRILRRFHRPVFGKCVELFKLGAPMALSSLFEAMIFNTMTLVVGTLGAVPLAAHQITLNFASLTFMAPLGVGMAATIRVGEASGAGDRAGVRRAGFVALATACAMMGLAGLAMALFGRTIASLYVSPLSAQGRAVVDLAATLLQVAAAFQIFDAAQVVAALSLRGMKDARAPMIIAGGAYWLAGAPVCVGLAFGAGLGALGVWIGLAFGLGVAAAALVGRFVLLTRDPRRH